MTTDTTQVQRTIKNYQEQLYTNKLGELEEIGKFLVSTSACLISLLIFWHSKIFFANFSLKDC